MIDNDPIMPIRSITRCMGVSDFHIRRVVHEDIGYFSYKMRKGQCLLKDRKDKKKDRAEKLLNKLKYPFQPNMLYFFPNKKNFFEDQMVKSQNNLWLPLFPQDERQTPHVLLANKSVMSVLFLFQHNSDGNLLVAHYKYIYIKYMLYTTSICDEPGGCCWQIHLAVDKINKMITRNKECVGVSCDHWGTSFVWV